LINAGVDNAADLKKYLEEFVISTFGDVEKNNRRFFPTHKNIHNFIDKTQRRQPDTGQTKVRFR